MKILVFSDNYPSSSRPAIGTFLYRLVQKMTNHFDKITVVSPVNPKNIRFSKKKYGEEKAIVYRPLALSFSAKTIGRYNTYMLTRRLQVRALKATIRRQNIKYDAVYAHFIKNGINAAEALGAHNTPIFTAVGESYLAAYKNKNSLRDSFVRKHKYDILMSRISGFVAVSELIKEKLMCLGVESNKIIVEPNGVDLSVFYPRDKAEMRSKYNIPIDKKVIAFVGTFNYSKGADRVLSAIEQINNVVGIFIGRGSFHHKSSKIVFCNEVGPNQIPELLSCADVFVLPTLNEGSSNSIIEAMACGLPIISSNTPEVAEQVDKSFSILVDPLSVNEIRNAIEKITNNIEIQSKMSKYALKTSISLCLEKRAERISAFIKSKTIEYHETYHQRR